MLGACLAGLFGNVALMQSDGSYKHAITRQVSRCRRVGGFQFDDPVLTRLLACSLQPIYIHPGSLMYQKRAPGIMYDELILTTKTYARGVSGIELAWLRSKVSIAYLFQRAQTYGRQLTVCSWSRHRLCLTRCRARARRSRWRSRLV